MLVWAISSSTPSALHMHRLTSTTTGIRPRRVHERRHAQLQVTRHAPPPDRAQQRICGILVLTRNVCGHRNSHSNRNDGSSRLSDVEAPSSTRSRCFNPGMRGRLVRELGTSLFRDTLAAVRVPAVADPHRPRPWFAGISRCHQPTQALLRTRPSSSTSLRGTWCNSIAAVRVA